MGEAKRRKAAGQTSFISRPVEKDRMYDRDSCECIDYVGVDGHFLKLEFMGRKIRDKIFSKVGESGFIEHRVRLANETIKFLVNLNGERYDDEMKSLTVAVLSNDYTVKRMSIGDIPDEMAKWFDEMISTRITDLKEIIKAKRLEEACGDRFLSNSFIW